MLARQSSGTLRRSCLHNRRATGPADVRRSLCSRAAARSPSRPSQCVTPRSSVVINALTQARSRARRSWLSPNLIRCRLGGQIHTMPPRKRSSQEDHHVSCNRFQLQSSRQFLQAKFCWRLRCYNVLGAAEAIGRWPHQRRDRPTFSLNAKR